MRKIAKGILPKLVVCLLLVLLLFSASVATNAATFTLAWLSVLTCVMVFIYRVDPLNIITAYWAPWLLMLAFSLMDISEFHRGVSISTTALMVGSLLMGAVLLPPSDVPVYRPTTEVSVRMIGYKITGIIFLGFCVLNVALAGYVPLIRQFTQGDSGYVDFGVKGLYGTFNAFANAFGVTSFYLWQRTRKAIFRNYLLAVAAAFTLFVTRQNLISLIIECFVVYSFAVRRLKMRTLVVGLLGLLIGFSLLGDLRQSGRSEIATITKIYPEFNWLPNAFVWVYAYFYFNLLNLDNAVTSGIPPSLDGSSLYMFIPSFLRPLNEATGAALEVSYFTAHPFITDIYQDVGIPGVMGVILIFSAFAAGLLRRMRSGKRLFALGSYSTLFFCFSFSFFENFFFYLPVIAQVAFFWMFERYLLGTVPARHPPTVHDGPPRPAVLPEA